VSELEAADEGRHAPGAEPWWGEAWLFDFWVPGPDGPVLGGYACLTLLPNRRRAWYWSALVGRGRPLVSVVDLEVALPRSGLAIRSDGLWADHVCESPFEHWTVGSEALAVTLDDPDDALEGARGVPTPLGFDLEWEATAAPRRSRPAGYVQACAVHGEVLVGPTGEVERLCVDGVGHRAHWWGLGRWWDHEPSTPAPSTATLLRAPVLLGVDGRAVAIERALGSGGWGEWVGALPGS